MKQQKKSIYGEMIKKMNISELLDIALQANEDLEWDFNLHEDWVERLENTLRVLDFNDYNYISDYGVYWCGILTAEPFDSLVEKYGSEETILNMIKDNHFKFVRNEFNEVTLEFYNPTASPLYRFFNKHKEDGFGWNIPYSVNALLNKMEKYLQDKLMYSLKEYGEWIPYVDEDEEQAIA